MTNRRTFLRAAGALLAGSPVPGETVGDYLGFRRHWIRKGDGKGAWKIQAAEIQFLHRKTGSGIKPFGIAQMDNGEVILAASWDDGSSDKNAANPEKPAMAFSRDGGRSWSDFRVVETAA